MSQKMKNTTKLSKLLVSGVPLRLEVEGENDTKIALELELAWTMTAVITIETWLRTRFGIDLNLLQNPGSFWTNLDCTKLALGVWACSVQEQPQYADDEGFETIQSFMNADNYHVAIEALRKAYLETLSKKHRDEILKSITEREEALQRGEQPPVSADPIVAPTPV